MGDAASAAADAAADALGGLGVDGSAGAADAKAAGGAPPSAEPSAASAAGEDPEKAAKRLAKKAEKEAKRAAALARAAAAAAAAAAPKPDGGKRAAAKAEAEAKRAAEAAEAAEWIAAARATPAGEKKALPAEMPRCGYQPRAVEAGWYSWWEARGFFAPEARAEPGREPFVMVIPPPNVTGSLHIGHALTNAVEDAVVRWRRMRGHPTLWVPGTDHAGIATQTVVEKQLARTRGLSRHDLGRDAFVAEVWKWVDEYGGRIWEQQHRMGISVDWGRKAFTMDAKLSAAVQEAFVRLHAEGLVYRDNRLVNWCCRLRTAVSDIEVDYLELPGRTLVPVPGYAAPVEFGVLTSFAYPLEAGGGEVVVATTRPETMLGDVAVAVHPDDPRYAHLRGARVVHPVSGRRLPVVCDAELVDMAFGTGAVKITPAHDANDYAVGRRHGLPEVNILDDGGALVADAALCGPFAGMPRFEARAAVVAFLKERGLFRGVADNAMRVPVCSRSKDVIEPVLKPQWYVACGGMAADAAAAVTEGRLRVLPREHEAVWHRWMGGIRDWCVSRQLWWGHRIPAYYVVLEGGAGAGGGGGAGADGAGPGAPGAPSERMDRWVVARSEAEAAAAAAAKFPGQEFSLRQDEDVLDTWFSSGLFPFSVFGWPDEASPDLARFYPTSLLETGHDILFFWVARMVMLGLKLTGRLPFHTVYLHAIVRDAHGRKMSKSLGNVVDPLHVIDGISLEGLRATLDGGNLDPREVERAAAGQRADFPDGVEECGSDALRLALVQYTAQGRDVNLDIKRVVACRHWCNKLWNAVRFAVVTARLTDGGYAPPPADPAWAAAAPRAARWVLSRLSRAAAAAGAAFEAYDFAGAAGAAVNWWQTELCDVFIELAKPALASGDAAVVEPTRHALFVCLEAGLRLLHPLMPFVTEELWQRLPRAAGLEGTPSIMVAPFPEAVPAWEDAGLEAGVAYALGVVTRARALRADYGLTPRQRPAVFLACADGERAGALRAFAAEMATLLPADAVEVLPAGAPPPRGCGVAVVDDATTAHLTLAGVLDVAKEVEKLAKREADAAARQAALAKKMAAATYEEKTPADIRARDADAAARGDAELAAIRHHQAEMRRLAAEAAG